jgi:hypothetical protein
MSLLSHRPRQHQPQLRLARSAPRPQNLAMDGGVERQLLRLHWSMKFALPKCFLSPLTCKLITKKIAYLESELTNHVTSLFCSEKHVYFDVYY